MKKLLSFILLVVVMAGCSPSKKEESSQENKNLEQPKQSRFTKKYTEEEIMEFDSSELRIKRNEIFAQYGYKFKSSDLKDYFESTDWYEPKYDNVDSFLTELDKENIRLLSAREQKLMELKSSNCDALPNELSTFVFNSSIQSVIDSLGAPDKTFLDDDMTCPIGQLHFWKDDVKNQQVLVLGDDYSGVKNYSAKSRYYAVQYLNTGKESQFQFNTIALGDSEESVKKKLDCLLLMNPGFVIEETSGKSVVEVHYVKKQSKQYLISDNALYIRFIFDAKRKLKVIVFSNFNDHLAC